MAIQVRPEINLLTTPPSYSIRVVPRAVAGRKEIAADIALRHPNFSKADIMTIISAEDDVIQARLLNGEQVTKEGCCSWYLSVSGRLNSPDDPLPLLNEALQINVRISPPYAEFIRRNGQPDRLAMAKKVPLINETEDTLLGLKDVLNPAGVLQLTGTDLWFNRTVAGAGECVIEGTQSGRTVQSRLIKVENGEILLMPDIPAQAQPWNNEYKVTVSSRYSEHGSLRTGTYSRMLRTPLVVLLGSAPGILTGKEAIPNVSVTNASLTADETLRIQAVYDARVDALLFSLLDMQEDGKTGAEVSVTANGVVTLQGFVGSAVSSLSIEVNDYAALKDMIRNNYSSRVVDVLQVKEA
jgi:hypothetical protein